MPRKDRLQKRNNHIKLRYRYHRKKNPKWTLIAVIEEVAVELFLAPSTISRILKSNNEAVPCADTVIKKRKSSGVGVVDS